MNKVGVLVVLLSTAVAGAGVYALLLLRPPGRTASSTPVVVDRPERAPAPPAPSAPTPLPTPPPPPAPTDRPPETLADLHITDAESAAIRPVLHAAQERGRRRLMESGGRLPNETRAEEKRKMEEEMVQALSVTLGPTRARQFLELTKGGRLPETYRLPQ